jgi:hypothetical protein
MNALACWTVALAVTVAMGAAAAYYDAEASADVQDAAAALAAKDHHIRPVAPARPAGVNK